MAFPRGRILEIGPAQLLPLHVRNDKWTTWLLQTHRCDFAPYDPSIVSQEIAVLVNPPCHCFPPVRRLRTRSLVTMPDASELPAFNARLQPDTCDSTTHRPCTAAPAQPRDPRHRMPGYLLVANR